MKRQRICRGFTVSCAIVILMLSFVSTHVMGQPGGLGINEEESHRNVFVISPLIGFDNNTLHSRDRFGNSVDLEDTGFEYGLFALYSTEHFTLNNMTFFTDVNDTDVSGNIFYANYYYNPRSRVTLNLGLGYLYHKIDADSTEITINAPLPKLGLRIDASEWGMYLNPYVSWISEDIDTTYGDRTDEGFLYGLTVGWRWRFLSAYAKYYYHNVTDSSESYNVARLRGNIFLTKKIGITTRFEYMEHSTSDDISFLIGPAFVF